MRILAKDSTWKPATVASQVAPRLCVVHTSTGGSYHRNRKHLRTTKETEFPESARSEQNDENEIERNMSEPEAAITQPSQAEQTPAHTYTPIQQPSSKLPIPTIPTPHTTVMPTSEPQTPHRSNRKIIHTKRFIEEYST